MEKYFYDLYGRTTIKDGSNNVLVVSAIGNRFCFTGREYDSETGNYYYRERYYSPDIGRFLQTDPIGYYDSTNLYQYCKNSPNNFIDPMGMDYVDVSFNGSPIGTGAGAIAGGAITLGNPAAIYTGAILGSLGLTGGVMYDLHTHKAYFYIGPSLTASAGPTASGAITLSPNNPISAWNVQYSQVTGINSYQVGWTFDKKDGGIFVEGGRGYGAQGGSISVYYPIEIGLPQFIKDYLAKLADSKKQAKCGK